MKSSLDFDKLGGESAVQSLFTFAVLDAGNIWGGFFFVLAITALAGIQRCSALVADLVKHFSLPLFVAVAAENSSGFPVAAAAAVAGAVVFVDVDVVTVVVVVGYRPISGDIG